MVKQTAVSDESICYQIAYWDPDIEPELNSSSGLDRWQFEYYGACDCGDPCRILAPTFICDESVDVNIGEVTEVFPGCYYEVEISIRYACENFTTTTIEPSNGCIWEDGNGNNTLNQTRLDGFVLNYVDNNEYIWSISPCNNGILCRTTALYGMGTVGTLNNCLQRIALWDGGITQPAYSTNNGGQWEFVYENGDSCGSAPTAVTRIFWNCDPLAGTGRITAVREIEDCDFEIQIDSNLAC